MYFLVFIVEIFHKHIKFLDNSNLLFSSHHVTMFYWNGASREFKKVKNLFSCVVTGLNDVDTQSGCKHVKILKFINRKTNWTSRLLPTWVRAVWGTLECLCRLSKKDLWVVVYTPLSLISSWASPPVTRAPGLMIESSLLEMCWLCFTADPSSASPISQFWSFCGGPT